MAIEKDKSSLEVKRVSVEETKVEIEASRLGLARFTEKSRIMLADTSPMDSKTKLWHDNIVILSWHGRPTAMEFDHVMKYV